MQPILWQRAFSVHHVIFYLVLALLATSPTLWLTVPNSSIPHSHKGQHALSLPHFILLFCLPIFILL